MNPLLWACQVDSSQFRLPCALNMLVSMRRYAFKSLNINLLARGKI